MKLKKLVQYGLMTTCLLGNAMAMNETRDLPINAISRQQSIVDIKAASELASAESREFHIFLGANPSEAHVIGLRAEEEKREIEEGIKAPIRLFFVNACEMYGIQTPSARTPILNGDFNNEENWDTILEALMLSGESFNGVVDKLYFDVSTAKGARWGEKIFAKIAILSKKSIELYIPDAKLASQSFFCDSEVDQKTYHALSPIQKRALPYPPSRQIVDKCFLSSGGLTSVEKRNETYYVYNSLNLVYDTAFQSSEIIGYPLKFEAFENDKPYPNIGMDYRIEPKEVQQYFQINSFIKVTLDGVEKEEAEEISLKVPTVNETEIEIKENKINETARELPTNAETTTTSIVEGYKEIKFPSLALIKEKLNYGNSLVSSETDCFNVQSIMGVFMGFTSPVLDVKMKYVGIFADYKDKDFYNISGVFDVIFEGDKKINIFLKSPYRKEREYIVQGGTKTERGNAYMVSDPKNLKIMVPIKK